MFYVVFAFDIVTLVFFNLKKASQTRWVHLTLTSKKASEFCDIHGSFGILNPSVWGPNLRKLCVPSGNDHKTTRGDEHLNSPETNGVVT